MPAVTPELSLESAIARNPYLGAARDTRIASDSPHSRPRKAHQTADFRRPAWLSTRARRVHGRYVGLVSDIGGGATAFAVYFDPMDQRVAQPERHIPTAFFGRNGVHRDVRTAGRLPVETVVETGLAGDACPDDLGVHTSCFAVSCLSEQDIRNLFPRFGGGLIIYRRVFVGP